MIFDFRMLFTQLRLWIISPVSYQLTDLQESPVTLQVK
jgi:hypothetical protein